MKKLILILLLTSLSQISFANTNEDMEIEHLRLMRAGENDPLKYKKLACDGYSPAQVDMGDFAKRADSKSIEYLFWLIEASERGSESEQLYLSYYYNFKGLEKKDKYNLITKDLDYGYKWLYIYSKTQEYQNKLKTNVQPYEIDVRKYRNELESLLSVNQRKKIEIEADKWVPLKNQKIVDCDVKLNNFVKNNINEETNIKETQERILIDKKHKFVKELTDLESKNDMESIFKASEIYYYLYSYNKHTEKQQQQLLVNLKKFTDAEYPEGVLLVSKIYQEGKLFPKDSFYAFLLNKQVITKSNNGLKLDVYSYINSYKDGKFSKKETDDFINYFVKSSASEDKRYLTVFIYPNNVENINKILTLYESILKNTDDKGKTKITQIYYESPIYHKNSIFYKYLKNVDRSKEYPETYKWLNNLEAPLK